MFERFQGVEVRVPATSANLGPGFDALGLALALCNTFTVTPSDALGIEVEGHGDDLPRDESNLFYKAFRHGLESEVVAPPVHIRMEINIPPGRGLGSSATAVVGGLLAANAMLGGRFEKDALLRLAIRLERGQHADNVAPALLGGLVVTAHDPLTGKHSALAQPFPADLRVVLLIPGFAMDTVQGRALMPEVYSRKDVVYNTGRVALLLAALQSGRYDLLSIAMQDRMHQPYRAQLFPMMPALIQAAIDQGAYGACLSGGGSSILALASLEYAEQVRIGLLEAARQAGIGGEARILDVDREGAKVRLL